MSCRILTSQKLQAAMSSAAGDEDAGAGLDRFSLFPRLPAEIRLRIWELIWPDHRVVEHARRDNPQQLVPDSESDSESDSEPGSNLSESHDPVEFDYLRLSGRLSYWLQEDISSRDETVEPREMRRSRCTSRLP